jgi:maleylacetate reductase
VKPFTYAALPAKVVFGFGTIGQLGAEIEALGCRSAMLLTTSQQAQSAAMLAEQLGKLWSCSFAEAAMHTPVDVTERALAQVRETGSDCLVAIGGGSSIGLGKAIALRTGLPQIAVPTTYAGSEATPIVGQTEGGRKTTQRVLEVLPETIIYDVDLTLTLPVGMSVTSGVNAIAHAVEALYAHDANPIITSLAEQGIRSLIRALPGIVRNPRDANARSDALFGAYACGVCLGAVGMSVHHKLCHTLGGSFDLPHAETHAVILPHAVAYVAPEAPEAMTRLSDLLGGGDPAAELFELARNLGSPMSLAAIGMPQSWLDEAADLACSSPYWSPRPVERRAIRALLENAFYGRRPL